MDNTPIALFIYNRPDHLRNTIQSLRACHGFEPSSVVVFGDGPKSSAQVESVAAARRVARELLGDVATYRFADTNQGLARSIIDGVSQLTTEHGRAIVVEDDLTLAPDFLKLMNAALDRYEGDERVFQVSGHMFSIPEFALRQCAVMLPFTTTWGWATWRRAWSHFDEAAVGWQELFANPVTLKSFNLNGVYDYGSMLRRQMSGEISSWGIRWYWSVFRSKGLVVYPPHTLVRNHGFDGSGSHGRGLLRRFSSTVGIWGDGNPDWPPAILDEVEFRAVRRAIYRQNGGLIGSLADATKRSFVRQKKSNRS